jgi:hypothetical protein
MLSRPTPIRVVVINTVDAKRLILVFSLSFSHSHYNYSFFFFLFIYSWHHLLNSSSAVGGGGGSSNNIRRSYCCRGWGQESWRYIRAQRLTRLYARMQTWARQWRGGDLELWRDKVNGRMRRMPGQTVYSSCTRFSRHRFTRRGRSTVKRKTWMINEGCRRHWRCKHTYNVYTLHVLACVCVRVCMCNIYVCTNIYIYMWSREWEI